MSPKLIGEYQTTTTGLKKSDCHLVFGTRHTPTPTKPKTYLLEKKPNGKYSYISSLYNSQEGITEPLTYTFDYSGTYYLLEVNTSAGKAKISLK